MHFPSLSAPTVVLLALTHPLSTSVASATVSTWFTRCFDFFKSGQPVSLGLGPNGFALDVDERTTTTSNLTEALESDLRQAVPQCNDAARAWIRIAFHDCGTFDPSATQSMGGCDGSLIQELDRPENRGLGSHVNRIADQVQRYPGISIADGLALAGRLGFEVCTGQTLRRFDFGRVDQTTTGNAPGRLPPPSADAALIRRLFVERMGFSAVETVALIGGAHSTAVARARADGIQMGPLDTTPHRADRVFFEQLQQQPSTSGGRIAADTKLLNDPEFAQAVSSFAQNEELMLDTYRQAFERLLQFGRTGAGASASAEKQHASHQSGAVRLDSASPVVMVWMSLWMMMMLCHL